MSKFGDLAEVASHLQRRGVDAFHEFVYGPHGCLEGLDVGEDFFPLWELNLPENQEFVAAFDFLAIKARRGPDWSVERRTADRAAEVT
jgi:hypothetical protein